MEKRLTDAGDVAVSENPEHPGEEPLLPTIAPDLLRGEKSEERLGDGEAVGSSHWCESTVCS